VQTPQFELSAVTLDADKAKKDELAKGKRMLVLDHSTINNLDNITCSSMV